MTGELLGIDMVVERGEWSYTFDILEKEGDECEDYYLLSIMKYHISQYSDVVLEYTHSDPAMIYNKFHEYYTKLINGDLDE